MISTWPPSLFFLLSPLAALGVMLIVQTFLLRLSKGERFFSSVVWGFIFGFTINLIFQAGLLLIFSATLDHIVLAVLVNIPLYICLAYCYYNFINLGQCSIRIRIYKECADRGGFLTAGQLREVYDEQGLRKVRIERLLHGGDLVERDGTYFLANGRLVPVAKFVFALKKFVLGRESEFDHLA